LQAAALSARELPQTPLWELQNTPGQSYQIPEENDEDNDCVDFCSDYHSHENMGGPLRIDFADVPQVL